MKKNFLGKVVVNAIAIYLVARYLSSGFYISSATAAVIAGIVLGFVNAIIRPLLILVSLPLNILTLGLFTFVVNGLMLQVTDFFVPGMQLNGFFNSIWISILISIISLIINGLLFKED